jgi:hypothetical protein
MSLTAAAIMPRAAVGSATVVNHCPKPVYYHASGYKNGKGWDGETKVIPAEGFNMQYDTTVSVKLFHDPAQLQGSISQLEFNLDTADGRIWYDISNVDAFRTSAPPFMEGGMHLTTIGEKHGNCIPVHCTKGELLCKGAYNSWNDDMTFVCPQATNLHLVLCPDRNGKGPSPPPAVAPPQPPKGGTPGRRPRPGASKRSKVPDGEEVAELYEKRDSDSVMVGGLTWETSGSSKSHVAKLPVLCLVASLACYFIAILG